MKMKMQKLFVMLIITVMAAVANAAVKGERITLKNGKGSAETTLNPSRTYRFVIASKEFKTLSIEVNSKGGKIMVEIKSPSGKILKSSTDKSFRIQKLEKGDYQISIKNVGNTLASVGMKLGNIDGESKTKGRNRE